jgi:hypothetical protein
VSSVSRSLVQGRVLSRSAQGNISRTPIVYLRHHQDSSHPSLPKVPSDSGTPPCYPRGGVCHPKSTTRTRHRSRQTSDLSSTLLLLSAPLPLDARVRRAGRPHCCATPHHQHTSSSLQQTSGSHGVAWPRVAHGRRGCRLPLQGLRRGAPVHT